MEMSKIKGCYILLRSGMETSAGGENCIKDKIFPDTFKIIYKTIYNKLKISQEETVCLQISKEAKTKTYK